MRQRTISDFFWRDPLLCNLTQEDKATLLYFLTCPESNMVGVYQIVWNIAGAEMGWTRDQLMQVALRLKAKKLLDFTDDGWIFVKIWWKHNSWNGAFSPKLAAHSKKQILMMPSEWKEEFISILAREGMDTTNKLIPYLYPIDRVAPNSSFNCNGSLRFKEFKEDFKKIQKKTSNQISSE